MSNMDNFSREYQPPKIPSHWTAEERRYAQAVTDVLDDIYLRYGRLNKKDLSGTLSKEITDASGNISFLQQTASQLLSQISSAEGNISTLQQLADSIKLEVSNTKIYRYASEPELIAALTLADVDMAVGLLWLDTTNNLMKRCSVVSPLTWENVQADEVHTSYIDILGSLIKLYSGGKIEMVSGSTIDMLAGSFFKLLSGSGITAISLDNSRVDGAFLMLGGETPETAPFVAYNDGTIKNVANTYVQTAADNADATHGIVLDVFFPADVTLVDKVLLSCKFAAFRAYETGAASGGGQTSSEDAGAERTSRGGGSSTESSTSSGSGTTGASADLSTDYSNAFASETGGTGATGAATGTTAASADLSAGGSDAFTSGSGGSGATGGQSVSISGATGYKDGAGSHNHPVGTLSGGSHTHTGPSHSHSVGSHTHPIGSHSHGMNNHTHTGPSHTHTVGAHIHPIGSHSHSLNDHTHSVTIPSHTHIVDIPAHSHTVADHTHGITYGIYESTTPTTCTVYVDGTAVAALTNTGAFINADIAGAFLKSGGKIVRNAFHTVEIRPNTLGRISAHLYVKTTQVSKVAGTL